jgi:hypothetical protein
LPAIRWEIGPGTQYCSLRTLFGSFPKKLLILDLGFLNFDLSLKSCRRAKQAQFRNQKSKIINRKSVANRVAHLTKPQGPVFILLFEQYCLAGEVSSGAPQRMNIVPGWWTGR